MGGASVRWAGPCLLIGWTFGAQFRAVAAGMSLANCFTMKRIMKVVADYRERASGVPERLAEYEGVSQTFAQLKVGDYVVDDRVVFERKCVDDFAIRPLFTASSSPRLQKDMDTKGLRAALEECDFAQATSALEVVTTDSLPAKSGHSLASELLAIYETRSQILSTNTEVHARHLLASVEELVSSLTTRRPDEPIRFVAFPAEDQSEFVLFIAGDKDVIGCIRTVSKLNVSPERWTELWND